MDKKSGVLNKNFSGSVKVVDNEVNELLSSAIDAEDFEGVKLLMEQGAEITIGKKDTNPEHFDIAFKKSRALRNNI